MGGERPGGNFYEQVGGRATFERLVREFYRGVATDPVLAPMYPETDHEGAIQRLTGFLEQYWGGPTAYSEQRGQPRLRMRHAHVAVDASMRDAWVRCMRRAMDDCGVAGPVRVFLEQRFAEVADFLRNVPEAP